MIQLPMKVELHTTPVLIQDWYRLNTSRYTNRPGGYYFYPEGDNPLFNTSCFGPFATEVEAKIEHDNWKKRTSKDWEY